MRILVFGASGGTGREIVSQALIRGDLEVTAFVRNPTALEPASRLRIVQGDALDPAAVTAAIEGQDAVLSALGGRNVANTDLLQRAVTHVIDGMRAHNVRRLIVLGAAGAADMNEALQHQNPGAKVMFRTVAATVLSGPMHDHAAQERIILASDLDYTLVHAARLTDDAEAGSYRVEDDGLPKGATSVPRRSVADFMLDQLDTPKYVRKAPYIGA